MGPDWAKSTKQAYEPQGSAMDQDIDAEGIKTSGSLAHKWGPPGDHVKSSEPPSDERSE